MEKTMKRYGVNHQFSTSYHPQMNGQVENTNKALKRILEKTVKDNLAICSRKLEDALWAFRNAYKTPTEQHHTNSYMERTAICHLRLNTVHNGPLRTVTQISSLLMTLRDFIHFPMSHSISIAAVPDSTPMFVGSPDIHAVNLSDEDIEMQADGSAGANVDIPSPCV
ncbi:reverse transcriptase domain-containing protein [Tanacetum coccineum]|uniref:Reverse transcriptase domain-containing protein n=1 Tax=Tanacetum coccineum TaxID=301880 RepID=A0ABQ4WC30_9ASTR